VVHERLTRARGAALCAFPQSRIIDGQTLKSGRGRKERDMELLIDLAMVVCIEYVLISQTFSPFG
jgi:hypothetical protein